MNSKAADKLTKLIGVINMEEDIVALCKEPLEGYAPDDMRRILSQKTSESTLAQIIAGVSNQVGWIGHDIDDPENDSETNEKIIKEYNAWWELYKELLKRVIKVLENENKTNAVNHILDGIGYHYIIKPFMERNGYADSAGWWVKK